MADDRPDVEWLDDDVPAGLDEDLPQPIGRPSRQRRTILGAASLVAIGIAVAAVVTGTRDDGDRRAGPVIPTFSSGNGTGHFPVPGTSIAIIDGTGNEDHDGPFDRRTGRAKSYFPTDRCASGCRVSLGAPEHVRAALLARFPDVEAIVVQTLRTSKGFAARTIRARDGDREIRVNALHTSRNHPDYVQRVSAAGRTVVQALVHRPGLQIAVTVDRPDGSIDTTTVVSLAYDRRLLSRH